MKILVFSIGALATGRCHARTSVGVDGLAVSGNAERHFFGECGFCGLRRFRRCVRQSGWSAVARCVAPHKRELHHWSRLAGTLGISRE